MSSSPARGALAPRLLPALLLLLGACVAEPPPGAGPAAQALHWTLETADGRFLGSATGFGGDCLLTNQHVVAAAAGRPLVARRGAEAWPVARSRMAGGLDAALLTVPGAATPAPALRAAPPAAAEGLAVAGALAAVPMVQQGTALGPGASARFGAHVRAARLPVAPGFSGGPAMDAEGRLVGIVMAAATDSLAEAQRLAAGRPDGPLVPRTALLLDPVAASDALGPDPACAPRR